MLAWMMGKMWWARSVSAKHDVEVPCRNEDGCEYTCVWDASGARGLRMWTKCLPVCVRSVCVCVEYQEMWAVVYREGVAEVEVGVEGVVGVAAVGHVEVGHHHCATVVALDVARIQGGA